MESEGSLSHSQVPATYPYPEPARPVISLAQLIGFVVNPKGVLNCEFG